MALRLVFGARAHRSAFALPLLGLGIPGWVRDEVVLGVSDVFCFVWVGAGDGREWEGVAGWEGWNERVGAGKLRGVVMLYGALLWGRAMGVLVGGRAG